MVYIINHGPGIWGYLNAQYGNRAVCKKRSTYYVAFMCAGIPMLFEVPIIELAHTVPSCS